MRKVNFIQQMEFSECGLACMAMILNSYGYHISLNTLRSEYPSPRGGYSFLDLTLIAEQKNLNAQAFQASLKQLKQLNLPAILHWEHTHFVVLEKINDTQFHIVDPAKGKMKLSAELMAEKFTGYAMIFQPNKKFQPFTEEKESFFKKYAKQHWRWLLAVLILTLFLQVVVVSIPLFTQWFTDEILMVNETSNYTKAGFIIISIFTGYLILNGSRMVIITFTETILDRSIMKDFINRLLRLPFSFFDNRSSGDIIFRTNSIFYIRDILSSTFISIVVDLLLIISYTIVMINYSVELTLLLISLTIFLALLLVINSKVIKVLVDKNLRDKIKVQSLMTEVVQNSLDVKVLGIEKEIITDWEKKYEQQLQSTQRVNLWEGTIHTLTTVIQIILPLAVLWTGSLLLAQNKITIGTIIAFSSIATAFITPIISLSNHYIQLISLKAYFMRIEDILETKEEQSQIKNFKTIDRLKGNVEFQNVSFKYNLLGHNVIQNVSFNIQSGETLAIVGASGSGKSTISKLLLGLLHPSEGTIKIDGVPIDKYNLSNLRKKIGVVLQEARLFNGTIEKNIKMNANVSEEQIETALKLANLYDEVQQLPLKSKTIITEGGNNLSGGQRQRLILARALVHLPRLVVLDEATSSLDNTTEHIIKMNLNKLQCSKLIIAHRLETIVNADKILVLQEGKIAEMGTHDELMAKQSIYYHLYHSNTRQEELEELML
ncbi:peptidase domain-containing ABC transporter [Bacillus sp. H1a]|uniref:peptidase domain-containing ABC transporter n=1 Tax=Bacillus sp. H1a TaxID=1397276 RepID=UPI00046AC596|nr:peptidase domain-containing ABC transporter [Bacillus sp. H1a]